MQHGVFVVVAQMLVLDDLFDFMFAVLIVDLVRKIARKHERLVAHGFDQMMQRFLGPFAADKNSSCFDVAADIVADLLARLELDILRARIVLNVRFPAAVESF